MSKFTVKNFFLAEQVAICMLHKKQTGARILTIVISFGISI